MSGQITRTGRRPLAGDLSRVLSALQASAWVALGAATVAGLGLVLLLSSLLWGAVTLTTGVLGLVVSAMWPTAGRDVSRSIAPLLSSWRRGRGRAESVASEPVVSEPEPAEPIRHRAAAGPAVQPGPQSATPDVPTVLEGGSSAGQAPWHLPPRSSQSGIALDAARVGDLDVRAASVIGSAHRCVEPAVVRQDAYALALDANQAHLVIAVADGLGSSEHADVGARIAVSTAARELVAALDEDGGPDHIDAQQLFITVAGEIVGTGRARGLDERQLCCLLVVAAVPTAPEPDGSRRVWSAQIGDVSVWTLGARWQQETGTIKRGLDRNTVDAVLPFHPDQVTTRLVPLPAGSVVAVLTDGVGDLLSDVASAGALLATRWALPPHPVSYLADLCVDAPGQDDDRTAVMVWCGAGDAGREAR